MEPKRLHNTKFGDHAFAMPLSEIISAFGIKFSQYADGTHIYLAVDKDNSIQTSVNLAACTRSIYEWLLHNSLALNPNISEACMFGINRRVQSLKRATVAYHPSYGGWCINNSLVSHQERPRHNRHNTGVRPAHEKPLQDLAL